MALTADERAVLAAWLVELNAEMEASAGGCGSWRVTIREERPPPDHDGRLQMS